MSGFIRNTLKCLTNSWFVTLPLWAKMNFKISSQLNSLGGDILVTFHINSKEILFNNTHIQNINLRQKSQCLNTPFHPEY